MNGGAFDVVTKPVDFDELSVTLKRMQSAREVGSDFHDFFLLPVGRLGLEIANDPEMMAVAADCAPLDPVTGMLRPGQHQAGTGERQLQALSSSDARFA